VPIEKYLYNFHPLLDYIPWNDDWKTSTITLDNPVPKNAYKYKMSFEVEEEEDVYIYATDANRRMSP